MRDTWARSFAPVSMRELEAWKHDTRVALSRIPGLSVSQLALAQTLGSLVSVKGAVTYQGPNLEFVKVDIARVWGEFLAEGLKARHAFVEKADGFEFHFVALDAKDHYLTGTLSVVRKLVAARH